MSKPKKGAALSKREVLKVEKLVRRVAMKAARDPELTMVLLCTASLQPFLKKLFTGDRKRQKQLIAERVERISKNEGLGLRAESKKIVVRGALKFLRELGR